MRFCIQLPVNINKHI